MGFPRISSDLMEVLNRTKIEKITDKKGLETACEEAKRHNLSFVGRETKDK